MDIVKYRMTGENLRPRRTKLEIPGWAGEPEPRADGSHEYAWLRSLLGGRAIWS
jgi:hypothetical protein